MVKCAECGKYDGSKCTVLKAALAFPPDSEVVCPVFEPKKKPEPEKEAEPE